mmetsp:Transcript_8996/g.23574  ORF Transcript_8996/g.23574 Transcript_8996/m.23574 type:complete len:226 (-) Transcript_8996:1836-2513(-)
MRATATLRRRFMPPEKAPARWLADSVRRTSSILRSASELMFLGLMPLMAPNSSRCCLAERLSQRMSNWGQTPIMDRTLDMLEGSAMVCSRTMALPLVGGSHPVSMLMVVDLPAPLGPRSANSCRLSTEYQGHLTAKKGFPPLLNCCLRPLISMALLGAMAALILLCTTFSSAMTSSSVEASMVCKDSWTLASLKPQYAGNRKYQGGLRTPIASGSTLSSQRPRIE